jgi:peroxiredoxin
MNQRILIAVTLCVAAARLASGQGMLPGMSSSTTVITSSHPFILIGETVPKTLTLVDENGGSRPLLSYKSATDILVVGFFSPRCAVNQAVWRELKRLYNTKKDWHVSFVGVSVNSDETLVELSEAMRKAGLPYPAVRDTDQQVTKALNVTGTPEILVIDEWNQLRYRGPVRGGVQEATAKTPYAANAIDAVISHVDPVAIAEPPGPIGCPIQ